MKRVKHLFFILPLIIVCFSACSNAPENENGEKKLVPDEDTSIDERVMESIPEREDTLHAFRNLIRQNPDDASLYYQRARYYYHEQGKSTLALNDLETALEKDTAEEYLMLQSEIYWDVTYPTGAVNTLEAAARLYPESEEVFLRLAEYHMYLQKPMESLGYINRTLEINTYNPEAYFIRGYNFKEMENVERALTSFETAVELDPQYYEAYVELGLINHQMGNDRAIHYFRNALSIKPESQQALYGKGKHYQDQENYDDAIETYKRLTDAHPDHAQGNYNLGYLLLLTGDDEKAVDHFTKTIRQRPDFELAYYGRGLAFRHLGHIADARQDFEKVLELDSSFDLARQELATLN